MTRTFEYDSVTTAMRRLSIQIVMDIWKNKKAIPLITLFCVLNT